MPYSAALAAHAGLDGAHPGDARIAVQEGELELGVLDLLEALGRGIGDVRGVHRLLTVRTGREARQVHGQRVEALRARRSGSTPRSGRRRLGHGRAGRHQDQRHGPRDQRPLLPHVSSSYSVGRPDPSAGSMVVGSGNRATTGWQHAGRRRGFVARFRTTNGVEYSHPADRHCQPDRDSALRPSHPLPAQKMAMGFQGEPVPPTMRSGSPTTMNSRRSSASHACATSSSWRLSAVSMPIATSWSGWMG